jgi:hypothetical protein
VHAPAAQVWRGLRGFFLIGDPFLVDGASTLGLRATKG